MGHTRIIQSIQERMENNPPKTKSQYLQAIGLAAGELLCEKDDIDCQKRIMRTTIHLPVGPQGKAESGIHHLKLNVLPKSFDPAVFKSLEKLFFTSSLADLKEDPVQILRIMHEDFEDLKHNEDVTNEKDRMIGLVFYTVGMESAKQWHSIFNDGENPYVQLYNRLKPKRRKARFLQLGNLIGNVVAGVAGNTEIGQQVVDSSVGQSLGIGSSVPNVQGTIEADVNYTELLEADLIGVSAGLITGGFGAAQENESDIFNAVLEQASLASAKQVVNTFSPPEPDASGDSCILGIFCSQSSIDEDLDNPQGCKHPNSPYCNTTKPNPGDPVNPGGCIFDSSEFC